LNFIGVRRDTWWGYGLHVVFDNFRVPFTAVGFQYDLQHRAQIIDVEWLL